MDFYVYKNEQNVGPLTEGEVVAALRSGRYLPTDLGCRVGETEWKDLSILFPMHTAVPPPPVNYRPPPPVHQPVYQPVHQPQQQQYRGPVVVYEPPPRYISEGSDVGRMMYYQANQKSTSTAFLLWFFLGGFSAHRFYMGKTGSAIGQASLWWISLLLCYVLIGFLIVWIPALWIFIDVFLISGWVRDHNNRLAAEIGGARY
jgi:TM2 domain-containing membrane protein YozV